MRQPASDSGTRPNPDSTLGVSAPAEAYPANPPDSTATALTDVQDEDDGFEYARRFGGLSMEARLFLLGATKRAEFVRIVNACFDPAFFPPIPEDEK